MGTFDATRWLETGLLGIDVDFGNWEPPPYGEQDFYRRNIGEFEGTPFFVEWRCRTDAPQSEIPGVGGSVINSLGGAVAYHFSITKDLVWFRRDNSIPFVYVPITPGEFHTYRVEMYGPSLYSVHIDGALIDSGPPEATFPNASGRIIWGASVYLTPSLNEWDYVRYGCIPPPHSGDFDSDGNVDADDLYFFVDCLLGPDSAGPGCTWADMNGDGTVDGADIPLFVDRLTGG